MEAATMQMPQVAGTQQAMVHALQAAGSPQATGNGVQAGGTQLGGGMFAALLQQMLGTGGETALLGAGSQQKAMLVEQMRQQLSAEGTQLGMQLLAEMLAVNPGLVQQVDASELAELVGQMGQPVQQTAQMPTQNLAVMQELQQAVLTGTAAQPQPENAFAAQLAAQGGSPVQNVAQPTGQRDMPLQILTNTQGQGTAQTGQTAGGTAQGEANGESGLSGQAQFQRALFQAQHTTATASVESTEQAAPGEAPQVKKEAEPKADNVLQFPEQTRLAQMERTTELSKLEAADGNDILRQVKTGLAEGMKSGREEFVIKLKPEGLGEITVRMLEQAGKITMSIATTNAQTQRLLNNELAALRDAVRPYNVEVQHVESQNTQHFAMDQQRQSFAQQQQQNRQQQQRGTASYKGYDFEAEQAEQQAPQYAENGWHTVV